MIHDDEYSSYTYFGAKKIAEVWDEYCLQWCIEELPFSTDAVRSLFSEYQTVKEYLEKSPLDPRVLDGFENLETLENIKKALEHVNTDVPCWLTESGSLLVADKDGW